MGCILKRPFGTRSKRRSALSAALLLCLLGTGAGAADRYNIDQTNGTIRFEVENLGLFSSHGEFRRWDGTLTIDQDHPEDSKVDVNIQAGSVVMPWADGADLLRSPPFFDVAEHPAAHFTSDAISQIAANHYAIHGVLSLRGKSQPQTFDAKLVDRHVDPVLKTEIADFLVSGTLNRSMFGMTSDRVLISDAVAVVIRFRLRLGEALRDR